MNAKKIIALDIETAPLPKDVLMRVIQVGNAPANYKDPEKIAQWKRREFDKLVDKAALDPTTGELLAFGYQLQKEQPMVFSQDDLINEEKLLELLWDTYRHYSLQGYGFAGVNFNGFDIYFAKIRSHILGVKVPVEICNKAYGNQAGCYELSDWWFPFQRENHNRISLDKMAKALGHVGKNGDGALFYKVFAENKTEAMDYLRNDLGMTRLCIDRLCPEDSVGFKDTPELLPINEA